MALSKNREKMHSNNGFEKSKSPTFKHSRELHSKIEIREEKAAFKKQVRKNQ